MPGGRGFRATFPGISREVSSNGSLLNLQTPAFGTMGNNFIAKLVPSLWLAVTTLAYGVKCKKVRKKKSVFLHLQKYWFLPYHLIYIFNVEEEWSTSKNQRQGNFRLLSGYELAGNETFLWHGAVGITAVSNSLEVLFCLSPSRWENILSQHPRLPHVVIHLLTIWFIKWQIEFLKGF